jgi:hypothetical protein
VGVLSRFVALTPDDAEGVDPSTAVGKDPGEWSVDARGMTDVELGALEEILTGRELFEILAEPDEVVAGTVGSTSLVTHVRPEVVNMLADRAGTDWLPTAQAWVGYEELDGADPADLAGLLGDMADLADRVRRSDRQLYLLTVI